jgi:hypothetical protein
VQLFEDETQFPDERVIAGGVGNEDRSVTHAALFWLLLLALFAGS